MSEGLLLVDKPAGPTSHDVVALVRRALGTRKVGHGGTLDPFATGLLPILMGRATRLMPYLVGFAKRYTGTLRLGTRTDTDDITGAVVQERDASGVTAAGLEEAIERHTGALEQRPPAFSAKKVDGRPAHRRARRGEMVMLAPRRVEVHEFRVIDRQGNDVRFEVEVSSGTYVRALARDVGEHLGCGAHLVELRRIAVGPWRVEDATTLREIERGGTTPLPLADAVPHLPTRSLDAEEWDAVRHGRPLTGEGTWDAPAVALVADRALVAIAEPAGDLLKPRVVFEP